jgi:predicted ATPase/DNA-binding winged helix-turn-helix (wHTH) protein
LSRAHGEVLQFGEFTLNPSARLLTKAGEHVKLGSRALDLLVTLVDHAGSVMTKDALFAAVWPDTAIEDSNLRVNISALRKALGEHGASAGYIRSVPGRGYMFSAPVSCNRLANSASQELLQGDPGPSDITVRLVRIFGRFDEIEALGRMVSEKRLITITGPGGIGKTSVALAVADRLAETFKDGVLKLDLGTVEAGRHIPSLLASHLRLPATQVDPLIQVLEHLRSRTMLLLLDNCEHLVEAVARIVNAIVGEAPGVHILATSREPLRTQGECARRLAPLAFPTIVASLTLDEIRRYPAVQLLEERVLGCSGSNRLTAADAKAAVEICQKLDGLPLAIELAAARVATLGWSGVVHRLDEPFKILTKGMRTAAARHQSLRALIDWSYETLEEAERVVWRRLAVFRGSFSIEAADAIGCNRPGDNYSIIDVLDNLVQKSLVSVDLHGVEPKYRLLEALRLYAWDKLIENIEADNVRQRHAEHWCTRSTAYGDNWTETANADWLARHRDELANIRAAVEWAFSESGDVDLGISLVSASAPLWFKLLQLPELTSHLEHAIARVPISRDIDRRVVMRLHIALAHSIFHVLGPVPQVSVALDRALEIADELRDNHGQCQIIWALFGHYSTMGDYGPMMRCVERARLLAAEFDDSTFAATHDRIAALGFHLLGEHDRARKHGLRALSFTAIQRHDGGFVYDDRTAASSHLCRVHWMMGETRKSEDMIRATIERALDVDQPFAFGYFLVFGACPVAIWSGDLAALRARVALLTDASIGIPRTVWRISCEFYQKVLDYLEAQDGARKEANRQALIETPLTRSQSERLATFHWKLLRPEFADLATHDKPNWCTAEILRAKGERMLVREEQRASHEAEALFLRALDISRSQTATSWELRAAISLARLRGDHGNSTTAREARTFLEAAIAKIDRTLVTADLADAHALLSRPH